MDYPQPSSINDLILAGYDPTLEITCSDTSNLDLDRVVTSSSVKAPEILVPGVMYGCGARACAYITCGTVSLSCASIARMRGRVHAVQHQWPLAHHEPGSLVA